MAFTNTTDAQGINVISITGTELLGDDRNEDLVIGNTIAGTKSVITITYTNANFNLTTNGRGFTISGFNTDDLNENNATIFRLQNDNNSGVWNGIPNVTSIFGNTTNSGGTGLNTQVTTCEAFVDRVVAFLSNVGNEGYFFGGGGTQSDDFFHFTASKTTTATTTSLILTSKDDGAWSDVTLTYNANGTGTSQPGVNGTPGVTTAGTLPVITLRTGVTYERKGGLNIYTFASNTRLQLGNTVATSTAGTASTTTANGILNHDTSKNLIYVNALNSAESGTGLIANNYAPLVIHAASPDSTIDPSVYNFGIQTSATNGAKLISTTAQSVSVGEIVLIEQNGGADDNKNYQNRVADSAVTTSTDFTNTTNWLELADTTPVFSDGLGLYFANTNIGDKPGNRWYGSGQGGIFGGTNGHLLGMCSHGTANKGGILNINGGRIGGHFSVGMGGNTTFRNLVDAKVLTDDVGQPAGTEWLWRITNIPTIETRAFTLVGGAISFVVSFGVYNSSPGGSAVGNGTYELGRVNAGVALWNQANHQTDNTVLVDKYMTFRNPNFINNATDIAPYNTSSSRFCATRVQNCAQGSTLNINAGETTNVTARNSNAGHYVIGTREVDTEFTATDAAATRQIGSIYAVDTNRNANLSKPIGSINGNSYSDTDSYTYFGKFSGDSNLTEWTANGAAGNTTNAIGAKLINNANQNEVALFTYSLSRDGTQYATATQDTGVWRKNIRGDGDAGTATQDDFPFHSWMYENNYVTITTNLAGNGTAILSSKVAADPAISDIRSAIVTKNSGAQGTGMTLGNTAITTTTSNYTLDEIYDLVKIKKEQSELAMLIPNISTLLIQPSSLTDYVDFKTLSLTIGSGKWSVGTNHKEARHTSIFDLSKWTLGGGLILQAPTLSNLPTTVGTSTLNPTNLMTSTGGHTIGSGSLINGALTASGNGNSFGGRITDAVILSSSSTGVNSVSGTMDSTFTSAATSLHTLTGTNTGAVALANGRVSASSTYVGSSTLTASGAGDSSVGGNSAGKVTLGNASAKHTISVIIAAGGLQMGTGTKHLISSNITGPVTTTGTVETQSTYIGSSTLDASGTGDSEVGGTSGGKVTLGNASAGHTVSATISAGGLQMGTGAQSVTGAVTGAVATTGSISTGFSYSGSSTLTASGTGNSTIRGTSTGLVTLGNASTSHTLNATMTGGFVIGTGASSFDGTYGANSSAGNGNFAYNGVGTGNFNHGTGTLIFGASAEMTGTLTKSGSGNTNSLTMTAAQAATISLVVPAGTLEVFGVVADDFISVTGNIHENVAATTITFEIEAAEPTSFYCLYNQTDNTVVAQGTHTTAAKTTLTPITNVSSSVKTYRFYIQGKFNSSTSTFYQINSVSAMNNVTGANRVQAVSAIAINKLLTNNAATVTAGSESATFSVSGTGTTATGTITIANATSQIDASKTLRIFLLGARETASANASLYLRLVAFREGTADLLQAASNDSTGFDSDIMTMTAVGAVQAITAVDRTNTSKGIGQIMSDDGTLSVPAINIFPNPLGATTPQIRGACTEAIREEAADNKAIQTAVTAVAKRGVLTNIGQP